jgi:Na+/melibiose symporter-like transporter
MTILFFVYFGKHNKKIHTIYKQTSVFVLIFSMFLFCFISKAATKKNRHFKYDLNMLCLSLEILQNPKKSSKIVKKIIKNPPKSSKFQKNLKNLCHTLKKRKWIFMQL